MSGEFHTNTLAFQQYALHTAITNAQSVAIRLHLDEKYMTTNHMQYEFQPRAFGIDGFIVFGGRYVFGCPDGSFGGFTDRLFQDRASGGSGMVDDITNGGACSMTLKNALRIAYTTMDQLGVQRETRKYGRPTHAERKTSQALDGYRSFYTVQLPLYHFEWQTDEGFAEIDVSCINSNVAYFHFEPPCWKLYFPTNYFEMLGLPRNPVFVCPLHPWMSNGPPYKLFPYQP